VESLDFFNKDLSSARVGHCCSRGANGHPCCSSLAQVRMNAKRHAKNLLIVTKPGAMCLSRWLKSVEVVGWWALGIKVHGLFVRAWVQVAGGKLSAGARRAAAAALAGPAAGPAAADADPGDDPNVDQHKAKAKSRFRKGLHFMQDALHGVGWGWAWGPQGRVVREQGTPWNCRA